MTDTPAAEPVAHAVVSGSYDDYRVHAIVDSEADAQRLAERWNAEYNARWPMSTLYMPVYFVDEFPHITADRIDTAPRPTA